MDRKIMKDLKIWISEGSKLPYMLVGARQVGKTYILDEFCKNNFTDYIYINLEKDKKILDIFEETIDPEEIIFQIGLIRGKKIEVENAIIFLMRYKYLKKLSHH